MNKFRLSRRYHFMLTDTDEVTTLLFLRQFNIFKHGFNIIVGTQCHRRVHHITRQMRRETLNEIAYANVTT